MDTNSRTDRNSLENTGELNANNNVQDTVNPEEEAGTDYIFVESRGSEANRQQLVEEHDQRLNIHPFVESRDVAQITTSPKWTTRDVLLGAILYIICFFADKVRKNEHFPIQNEWLPIQESNKNSSSEYVVPSLPKRLSVNGKLITSGRFKNLQLCHLNKLMGDGNEIKPGVSISPGVFKSVCSKFFLKERRISKIMVTLQKWENLSSKFIVSLHSIIPKNSRLVYVVTKSMTGDLKFARRGHTLMKIWKEGSRTQWTNALKHAKHVWCSVLKGIQYLNNHGLQHYDLKETNVLADKPSGCHCDSLLGCNCPVFDTCKCNNVEKCKCGLWDIKLADFDTLDNIQQPFNEVGGTKYHRPPETKSKNKQVYSKPTYDTYSFGVLVLHMCVGYPNEDFENKALKLPWNLKDSRSYVMELLLKMEEAQSCAEMSAIREIVIRSIAAHYEERPTAEELLSLLNTL